MRQQQPADSLYRQAGAHVSDVQMPPEFARLDEAHIVLTPHLTGWLDDGKRVVRQPECHVSAAPTDVVSSRHDSML